MDQCELAPVNYSVAYDEYLVAHDKFSVAHSEKKPAMIHRELALSRSSVPIIEN